MITPTIGRSAWTRRGFPDQFTSMYRRHLTGKATGGEPERDWDFRAVHLGVLAIQRVLAERVEFDYSSGPGIFGPRTDEAVRAFQKVYVAPADGIVGPNTMKALLRPFVSKAEMGYEIPDHLLWGLIGQESGYDPGAVGYASPADLGLVQINTAVQTATTVEMAFDPSYAITWAAMRMRNAHDGFVRLYRTTDRLAWDCAVANHNSPAWARQWASTGVVPNTTISGYVTKVRTAAAKW